ncbi:MAG: OmcA/MtrC family decaheme c-type cytochrome [Candidatus Omnitrophica bacterium]|nr:OmcA/MtrC family decaheme c-type cytochrome [Candidatus Omnitrophota bacterium]
MRVQQVLAVLVVMTLFMGTSTAWSQGSADIDQSGFVDAQDQILFLQQWQTGGAFAPEEVTPAEQVEVEIIGVTVPADNRPEVTFALMNGAGQAIDPADLSTYRFTICKLVENSPAAGQANYISYITEEETNEYGPPPHGTVTAHVATFDSGRGPSGGVAVNITDNGDGTFTYKFADEIVIAAADMGLTHTVGAQIQYNLQGKTTYANPIFNFVPDGSEVTTVRELTNTMTCNECHTDLGLHGGGRKEIGLCILCHNPSPDNIDPDSGNSIDMKVMIHKIHMGADLPRPATDPYIIYGHNGSVNNYSEVLYPQDIRNCEKCHTGTEDHPEQADYWMTNPSVAACGSCHENVNFTTGQGHSDNNFPATDGSCLACHGPQGSAPIAEVHQIPRKAEDFPLLMSEIMEVANTTPGATPSVTFTLTQDVSGVVTDVDPTSLNRVAVSVAGPTVGDYDMVWTEIIGGNSTDNGDGTRTYMLAQAIPADAVGTWAFGIEARGNGIAEFDGARAALVANPVAYAAVTDSSPAPRRAVIDFNKCNDCHDELRLHGDLRVSYEYCIMCHNPMGSDIPFRDPATDPVTINFKDMIHKIHTGEELNTPYTVIGFGGSEHDYTEVLFPGQRNRCDICHVDDSYELPTPSGAANTIVENASGVVVTDITPMIAACTSCHDSEDALAHTESFLAINGGAENCAECHGKGAQWSVERVHAN